MKESVEEQHVKVRQALGKYKVNYQKDGKKRKVKYVDVYSFLPRRTSNATDGTSTSSSTNLYTSTS